MHAPGRTKGRSRQDEGSFFLDVTSLGRHVEREGRLLRESSEGMRESRGGEFLEGCRWDKGDRLPGDPGMADKSRNCTRSGPCGAGKSKAVQGPRKHTEPDVLAHCPPQPQRSHSDVLPLSRHSPSLPDSFWSFLCWPPFHPNAPWLASLPPGSTYS